MAYRVLIPTPLRPYTDQQDAVEVDGTTVGELLASLTARYGDLRKHLYSEEGKLRSFVNVYLNDDDSRYGARGDQAKDGDVVSMAVGGGGARPTRPDRADNEECSATPALICRGRTGRAAPPQGGRCGVGAGGWDPAARTSPPRVGAGSSTSTGRRQKHAAQIIPGTRKSAVEAGVGREGSKRESDGEVESSRPLDVEDARELFKAVR